MQRAADQAAEGKADDLGGGVFKKRLAGNRYRSILLTRSRDRWVFAYLYSKQDRANIDSAELAGFRDLARAYAGLSSTQVEALLIRGDWIEIRSGPSGRHPEDGQ